MGATFGTPLPESAGGAIDGAGSGGLVNIGRAADFGLFSGFTADGVTGWMIAGGGTDEGVCGGRPVASRGKSRRAGPGNSGRISLRGMS